MYWARCHERAFPSTTTDGRHDANGRTTSSLRISLRLCPWMPAAGGLNCTRISTFRSFSALPAFITKGTPAHLGSSVGRSATYCPLVRHLQSRMH